MRLVLKDEKYTFTVTKAAEPRTEYGSGRHLLTVITSLLVNRQDAPARERHPAA